MKLNKIPLGLRIRIDSSASYRIHCTAGLLRACIHSCTAIAHQMQFLWLKSKDLVTVAKIVVSTAQPIKIQVNIFHASSKVEPHTIDHPGHVILDLTHRPGPSLKV